MLDIKELDSEMKLALDIPIDSATINFELIPTKAAVLVPAPANPESTEVPPMKLAVLVPVLSATDVPVLALVPTKPALEVPVDSGAPNAVVLPTNAAVLVPEVTNNAPARASATAVPTEENPELVIPNWKPLA